MRKRSLQVLGQLLYGSFRNGDGLQIEITNNNGVVWTAYTQFIQWSICEDKIKPLVSDFLNYKPDVGIKEMFIVRHDNKVVYPKLPLDEYCLMV